MMGSKGPKISSFIIRESDETSSKSVGAIFLIKINKSNQLIRVQRWVQRPLSTSVSFFFFLTKELIQYEIGNKFQEK
jgi:hypothetical protein